MTLYDKINALLAKAGQSDWAARITSEMHYGADLSTAKAHCYDALLDSAADLLLNKAEEEGGVITKAAALEAEAMLSPMAKDAKSYTVHCVAHAHIDMNWMWGFQETTSVAVDTFRTMLDLMKEYPDFTFAQSQASTYKIVEEFAPEMVEEIKQRVHEGRWEISASTWVETDKNMPSGESLARHILYTKRYLSKLLDVAPESLQLDFEPDTFGHNITVPEICNKGGVKYYYHCRANDDKEFAYVWRARSGAELIVYCDPHFYGATIEKDLLHDVPQMCARYGIQDYMLVYGVGDHGGGPTRRDVDRLIEMNSWPIMPTIIFSGYHRFFKELEKSKDKLPVREGEINYVFTGCYTSQSRIKMANRIAEDRMYESEALCTAATLMANAPVRSESFKKAWENILFNHFHDILPGSGVIDTREYAMGQFQRAMAAIDTNANNAMRALAEAIDTSSIATEPTAPDKDCISQGAGVGFMVGAADHYPLPRAERGVGKKRIFHLFNTTQYDYDGLCDITVWDWNYPAERALFKDDKGNTLEYKLMTEGEHYWGHKFRKFALKAHVPALGYTTCTLDLAEQTDNIIGPVNLDRTDEYSDKDIVLENDKIIATFDHQTMKLLSLIDKATDEDMVGLPAASFRLIHENGVHGMASWRVGDRMTIEDLNESSNVRVYEIDTNGLRQYVKYDMPFGERSKLQVTVSLDAESSMLKFDVAADFHEVGTPESIPQLNFLFPIGYDVRGYRYDVPFGTLDREAIEHDVPANSFAAALPECAECKNAVMLISDTKYGFRGCDNALSIDLIRGSYEPDPYPEYGMHNMVLGVGVTEGTENKELYRKAAAFVHPVSLCTSRKGNGKLPLSASLLSISGEVKLSAVKLAEDFEGLMLRLYDESGKGAEFDVSFAKPVTAAYTADLNENITDDAIFEGNTVRGKVEPFAVTTLLVKF